MTPPATWRPDGHPRRAFILGPALCHACRQPVWFGKARTHVQGRTVVGEARVWRDWGATRTHRCIPKPLTKTALYYREYRARKKAARQILGFPAASLGGII